MSYEAPSWCCPPLSPSSQAIFDSYMNTCALLASPALPNDDKQTSLLPALHTVDVTDFGIDRPSEGSSEGSSSPSPPAQPLTSSSSQSDCYLFGRSLSLQSDTTVCDSSCPDTPLADHVADRPLAQEWDHLAWDCPPSMDVDAIFEASRRLFYGSTRAARALDNAGVTPSGDRMPIEHKDSPETVLAPAVTTSDSGQRLVGHFHWKQTNSVYWQVKVKGITVCRRQSDNWINGTKLLNVVTHIQEDTLGSSNGRIDRPTMTRGRRDSQLKSERAKEVQRAGPFDLKGVWIPLDRALSLIQKWATPDVFFPLFENDIATYAGHRDCNAAGNRSYPEKGLACAPVTDQKKVSKPRLHLPLPLPFQLSPSVSATGSDLTPSPFQLESNPPCRDVHQSPKSTDERFGTRPQLTPPDGSVTRRASMTSLSSAASYPSDLLIATPPLSAPPLLPGAYLADVSDSFLASPLITLTRPTFVTDFPHLEPNPHDVAFSLNHAEIDLLPPPPPKRFRAY